MVLRLCNFVKENGINVLVNFPASIDKMESNEKFGYVHHRREKKKETLLDFLKLSNQTEEKIFKSLKLVKLNNELLKEKLDNLTLVERQKSEFAYALLIKSNVIVIDRFFENLIWGEQQYFKRLLRNLVEKQKKSIILLENDMNFICEFVRKIILFDNKGNYEEISDFYDEKIYKDIRMPKTVELIKYFEKKGHQVDHEITFNETLKAIYRGRA